MGGGRPGGRQTRIEPGMTTTQRTTLLTVGVVVAAAALGVAWAKRSAGGVASAGDGGVAALTSGRDVRIRFSDKPVPPPAFDLQDLDGRPISLGAFKGKVVLINFWATWCGPCREEIPELIALQEHYKDQLVVLGLSVDERPVSEVKTFAASAAINYPGGDRQPGGAEGVRRRVRRARDVRAEHRRGHRPAPRRTARAVDDRARDPRAVEAADARRRSSCVPDTGQVLIANAAYATEIPGVDLTGVTTAQKEEILKRLNTEKCTCGCDRTLAQCRIEDPACNTSLPAAQKVAAEVTGRK